MKVLHLVLWLALATLLMPGLGAAAAPRPRIVTSFFPLYCWTVHVAGEFADVVNLLPGRVDLHAYSSTSRSFAPPRCSADSLMDRGHFVSHRGP